MANGSFLCEIMASDLTCVTRIKYLGYSSVCTTRKSLRARASGWRTCGGPFCATEGGPGRKARWAKAPPSISRCPSNRTKTHEVAPAHSVGGRQPRRRGVGRGGFEEKQTGQRNRGGTRRRGGAGVSSTARRV